MLQEKLKTVRTILYITENNKKWLEAQPRGQRTRIVNEAIQQLQNEKIRKEKKQRLLNTLDNLPLYATNGISPKAVLQAERDKKTGL
ncbi:MAG: hypothetical protein AAF669_08790 [Pseudomonadota bacterium]